jgi:hypothetical protein
MLFSEALVRGGRKVRDDHDVYLNYDNGKWHGCAIGAARVGALGLPRLKRDADGYYYSFNSPDGIKREVAEELDLPESLPVPESELGEGYYHGIMDDFMYQSLAIPTPQPLDLIDWLHSRREWSRRRIIAYLRSLGQ